MQSSIYRFIMMTFILVIALSGCTLANNQSTESKNLTITRPTKVEEIGRTKTSSTDHITLVYVPAGEFLMGTNDGLTDEQPVHKVYLDSYWIDQTEITNGMYAKCVQVGKCNKPSFTAFYDDPSLASHPVEYVSWREAVNYCTWVGRRLPTEAEWEKAAIWDPYANQQRV